MARIAANLGIESSDSEGMATGNEFCRTLRGLAVVFLGPFGHCPLPGPSDWWPSCVTPRRRSACPNSKAPKSTNGSAQGTVDRKGVEYKAFLMKHVFRNPLIWILGAANFFVYVVRFSVLDWGPSLLSQSKGVSMAHAGWLVAMFEIAGILGMLFAGWATDRWLKGRAHRTCVFCMAGAALFVFLFWRLPSDAPIWLLFATLCAAGFCIYGPQALIGIAAANQATKKAAATANGLTGLFGYASTARFGAWDWDS